MSSRTDKLIEMIGECRNRREAASVYEYGIHAGGIKFDRVNAAIVERWSVSGLKYIKRLVWLKP